jgi:hypothetical protein
MRVLLRLIWLPFSDKRLQDVQQYLVAGDAVRWQVALSPATKYSCSRSYK